MKSVHEGITHQCDQCQKSFPLKGTLKLHMKTHTEENPYICDVCSKSYKQEENLEKHMALHGEEDGPYQQSTPLHKKYYITYE